MPKSKELFSLDDMIGVPFILLYDFLHFLWWASIIFIMGKTISAWAFLFHGSFIWCNEQPSNILTFLVFADFCFSRKQLRLATWKKTTLVRPVCFQSHSTWLYWMKIHKPATLHYARNGAWVALPFLHAPPSMLFIEQAVQRHINRGHAHCKGLTFC